MQPLLQLRHVTCQLADRPVLADLTLALAEGAIHAVLGANGPGKSTLAYVILGCEAYRLAAEAITFSGSKLAALPLHERVRLGITLAWQEPARFEGVTVRRYLTLGRSGVDASPLLAAVGPPPERSLDRFVDRSLSGGERHRIELASVLEVPPAARHPGRAGWGHRRPLSRPDPGGHPAPQERDGLRAAHHSPGAGGPHGGFRLAALRGEDYFLR